MTKLVECNCYICAYMGYPIHPPEEIDIDDNENYEEEDEYDR